MAKQAVLENGSILVKIAIRVRENNDATELKKEFESFIASEDFSCFLKYADGQAVGFTEANRIICFTKTLSI